MKSLPDLRSEILWSTVVAIVLTACASTTTDTTNPTDSTSAPSTTVAETTTSTAPRNTTTTAADTTTTTSGSVLDEADGSGCTPGEGNLPDGHWYGDATAADENTLSFDLACWFTGDAAARAAAEDGEESPPPNDYYVRNANPTVRILTVEDDVEVVWYPEFGDPNFEASTKFALWTSGLAERGEFIPGIWIEIEEGQVIRIQEQWVP